MVLSSVKVPKYFLEAEQKEPKQSFPKKKPKTLSPQNKQTKNPTPKKPHYPTKQTNKKNSPTTKTRQG